MKKRPIVICYDICNNKRRRRVHRVLKQWRLDGQESLCEAQLTWSQAEELMLQIGEQIDREQDKLLMAWLPQDRNIRNFGKAKSHSFGPSLIGIH